MVAGERANDVSAVGMLLWHEWARHPAGRLARPRNERRRMARWPRHAWTTFFTYGAVFVLFPVLCWLAYAFVQGWLF